MTTCMLRATTLFQAIPGFYSQDLESYKKELEPTVEADLPYWNNGVCVHFFNEAYDNMLQTYGDGTIWTCRNTILDPSSTVVVYMYRKHNKKPWSQRLVEKCKVCITDILDTLKRMVGDESWYCLFEGEIVRFSKPMTVVRRGDFILSDAQKNELGWAVRQRALLENSGMQECEMVSRIIDAYAQVAQGTMTEATPMYHGEKPPEQMFISVAFASPFFR